MFFGVTFITLAPLLGSIVYLETFLEQFGYTVGVKNAAAAPKVPQERPKGAQPRYKGTCWVSFWRSFSMMFLFVQLKQVELQGCYIF